MKQLLLVALFLLAVLPLTLRADDATASDPASFDGSQLVENDIVNKAENQQPEPFASKILQTKNSPAVGSGVVSADPVSVVIGLLLVVALIVVVAWLLRRVGALPITGVHTMRVLATLPLGTREKAVLVEVGDQQLLLGIAPGRVTHLQTFEQPIISNNTGAPQTNFSSTIKKILQKNSAANSVTDHSYSEQKDHD